MDSPHGRCSCSHESATMHVEKVLRKNIPNPCDLKASRNEKRCHEHVKEVY